jgi:hypothetical protein
MKIRCVLFAIVALIVVGCGREAPAPPPEATQAARGMQSREMTGASVVYSLATAGQPWAIVTAITTNGNSCVLAADDYTVVHLGYQENGVTASVAGDYVLLSRVWNTSGAAAGATMDLADGVKAPLFPGASITFPAANVPIGSHGTHEIQFQGVTHGAKLLIIRGRQ